MPTFTVGVEETTADGAVVSLSGAYDSESAVTLKERVAALRAALAEATAADWEYWTRENPDADLPVITFKEGGGALPVKYEKAVPDWVQPLAKAVPGAKEILTWYNDDKEIRYFKVNVTRFVTDANGTKIYDNNKDKNVMIYDPSSQRPSKPTAPSVDLDNEEPF